VVSPKEREAFLEDQRGFIAGRKLAQRYGWKTGDLVTLKGTIFLGDWDFVMRAVYQGRDENADETQFFLHWDYLNETVRKREGPWADQVGLCGGVAEPNDRRGSHCHRQRFQEFTG
jgi:putative ABC transport system permease protein